MKREIAEQWIKALRSGDYTQGLYALRTSDGVRHRHCCLGVLCELHAQAHPEKGGWSYSNSYLNHTGGLPQSVVNWIEMDDIFQGNLISANDHYQKTFEEIAEMIEKETNDVPATSTE